MRGRPRLRNMTDQDFETVRPFLKISENRCEAAKRALVDGETLQSIAKLYKCTRQAVNDSVTIVWNALEHYREIERDRASNGPLMPPGWEQVTLIAPSSLVAKFRAEIAETARAIKAAEKTEVALKNKAEKEAKAAAKKDTSTAETQARRT